MNACRMKTRKLTILVIFLTQSLLCASQIEYDTQEAFRLAHETQKPVLRCITVRMDCEHIPLQRLLT